MDYKRQSRLEWGPTVLLSVILVMLAYLTASWIHSGDDTPLGSVVRLNTATNREIQLSGKNVYYLEGGSLHCVTSGGKYVWNLGVDSDSQFSAAPYGIAVWSRRKLTVVDPETGHPLASKNMDADIISADVGDTYVAAVEGAEDDSRVVIMDHYGNVVDTLTDFSGYTVLDFGFFEGRELFWIMTLDSTGSVPTCKISTYIPGKRETGTISDSEQVIYRVMFRSSYIEAVGTDYIRLYDYTGAELPKQRTTVYGWYMEAVDKSTDNPLMLFVPNRQAEDRRAMSDVRMILGSDERIVHLPVACKNLAASGTDLYGFSEDTLVKCSFGQKSPSAYKMPVLVDNVIGITTDKTAVVTSGGSIYLIRVP